VASGLVIGLAGLLALAQLATAPSMSTTIRVQLGPDSGVDPARQLRSVLHHPAGFAGVVIRTLDQQGGTLLHQLVGRLGLLTVPLPAYLVMALGLVAGFILLTAPRTGTLRVWQRSLFIGVVLATAAATCLSLYATWTPVAAPVITGLQGRYFTPLFLLGMLSIYGLPAAKRSTVHLLLLAAGIAAAVITIITVVLFYYP
jgi:uncharacterized membrane protein